jgi:hypothetical protein
MGRLKSPLRHNQFVQPIQVDLYVLLQAAEELAAVAVSRKPGLSGGIHGTLINENNHRGVYSEG